MWECRKGCVHLILCGIIKLSVIRVQCPNIITVLCKLTSLTVVVMLLLLIAQPGLLCRGQPLSAAAHPDLVLLVEHCCCCLLLMPRMMTILDARLPAWQERRRRPRSRVLA